MSEPFLGQIEMFGFGFAPRNWAFCAGQTLSIQQNQALFALLGTTYGGNGSTNFMLPDLRGTVPLGVGSMPSQGTFTLGQTGGEERHVLTSREVPSHTHSLMANSKADPANSVNLVGPTVVLGPTRTGTNPPVPMPIYVTDADPSAAMDASAIGAMGGQPHENRMPSLVVNFCIALNGIFPSRN
jgi:microcystin-dependent protein